MAAMRYNLGEINVLASEVGWAWPVAMREIFEPRGVNLLMARSVNDFVSVIERRRIHTAIVDIDSQESDGLTTIKIIRIGYPLIPCIVLTDRVEDKILSRALELDVFSVIDKPVDMDVLLGQLNKLFVKRYGSDVFG
jgi:DNA-binding NtrC family response regulator